LSIIYEAEDDDSKGEDSAAYGVEARRGRAKSKYILAFPTKIPPHLKFHNPDIITNR
jgi:hypothetical protein